MKLQSRVHVATIVSCMWKRGFLKVHEMRTKSLIKIGVYWCMHGHQHTKCYQFRRGCVKRMVWRLEMYENLDHWNNMQLLINKYVMTCIVENIRLVEISSCYNFMLVYWINVSHVCLFNQYALIFFCAMYCIIFW